MNAQDIAISNIRRDGGTQPRTGTDQMAVAEYAEAMKNGAEFPPVILFFDGTDYWLADGFHRVAASEAAGRAELLADVRQGTRRDAVLFSVGVNAHHGIRRSSADKRRAVETLLRDEEWRQWADREIGRRADVDHKTVGKIRSELIASGEIPQMLTRMVERGENTFIVTASACYPPNPSDDADVEAARQIALLIVQPYTRDEIKQIAMDFGKTEIYEWHFGAGKLGETTLKAGEVGVMLTSQNGTGVYRFNALQLHDWLKKRDQIINDEGLLKAMLSIDYGQGRTYLESKYSKKLYLYGLAHGSTQSAFVEGLTVEGEKLLAKVYEKKPILAAEREIAKGLREYRWPYRGKYVLERIYRTNKAGKWFIASEDKGWASGFAEKGYVVTIARINARTPDQEIFFFSITAEGCKLLNEQVLTSLEPLPDLPYHPGADCFVSPDAKFKFKVGDRIVYNRWPRKGTVVGLREWPVLQVKYDDLNEPMTVYENEVGPFVEKIESSTETEKRDTVDLDRSTQSVWNSLSGLCSTLRNWDVAAAFETDPDDPNDRDFEEEITEYIHDLQSLIAASPSAQRLGLKVSA